MIIINESTDYFEVLDRVSEYLNGLRDPRESYRDIAARVSRGGMSPTVVSDLLEANTLPSMETTLAIGRALGARTNILLRLLGLLEDEPPIRDPRLLRIVEDVTQLPEEERNYVIDRFQSIIKAKAP